ncbi:unnamed protein product [Cunninghamella blakesleeana]
MLRRLYIGVSQQRQQQSYPCIWRCSITNKNRILLTEINKRVFTTTNIPFYNTTTAAFELGQLDTINTESANKVLFNFAQQGQWEEAQSIYDKVFRYGEYKGQKVKADILTYGLLMEAYIKGGHVEDAMDIYYTLKNYIDQQQQKNINHQFEIDGTFYNRLISALTTTTTNNNINDINTNEKEKVSTHLGYTVEEDVQIIANIEHDTSASLQLALQLFQDMRHKDIPTNKDTYIYLIRACGIEKDNYILGQIHQLLRMDYSLELDQTLIYELMKTYYQVNDIGMLFELWESSGHYQQHQKNTYNEMIEFLLNICYEKKYKYHALRIWTDLPSSLKLEDRHLSTLFIKCLCESNEWDQAKSIIISSPINQSSYYSDMIQLLKHYGQLNNIDQEKWMDL